MPNLEKVSAGAKLNIPAVDYNAFCDAALAHKNRRAGLSTSPATEKPFGTPISVQNVTGGDLPQMNVVGIGGPVVDPAHNAAEFRTNLVLKAEVLTAEHVGRFGVLAGGIPVGEIGWAYVTGITPVFVAVLDSEHQFAEMTEGIPLYLTSGSQGSAQILWKPDGVGFQFAVVRLNGIVVRETSRLVKVTWVPGGGGPLGVQGYTADDAGVISRDGAEFSAYAWPGQANAHYELKMGIMMVAEKFGGSWFVHMTGDRAYTDWPTEVCKPCVP